MSRNIIFAPSEFYHIYNRGTDKRIVFIDDHDYERFLILLFLCNDTKAVVVRDILEPYESSTSVVSSSFWHEHEREQTLVDIGAYCLMQNHFHLFIREKVTSGTSQFMQKLSTAYTMYFNKRHDRTGALFQGRFKVRHIDDEAYFNWLFSYIHLNPVKLIAPRWKEDGILDKRAAEKFMKGYTYSSFHDYFAEKRPESAILSTNTFPDHFEHLNDFAELVSYWNKGAGSDRAQS